MAWQKGRSGNPAGRPPAGESFAEALRIELTLDKRAKLARKVIVLAKGGDMRALVFIRDSLDGRPRQAQEIMGEGGGPLVTVLLREREDVPQR